MIRKIIIFFAWILLFSNASNAKNPPLGTGSLVPANIMIMLDNSGSMAWDLRGRQPGTNDEPLTFPTSIDIDSKGNIYVIDYDTYRFKVFTSSGQYTKQIIQRNTSSPNPTSTIGRWVDHFSIFNDEIYVMQGFVNLNGGTGPAPSLRVFGTDGSLKRSANAQYHTSGGKSYPHRGIAVNSDYILDGIGTSAQRSDSSKRVIQDYNRSN